MDDLSMLMIYTIVIIIGTIIYSVIRINVKEWNNPKRMNRLSLKKRGDESSNQVNCKANTPDESEEIIEISDDGDYSPRAIKIEEEEEDEEEESMNLVYYDSPNTNSIVCPNRTPIDSSYGVPSEGSSNTHVNKDRENVCEISTDSSESGNGSVVSNSPPSQHCSQCLSQRSFEWRQDPMHRKKYFHKRSDCKDSDSHGIHESNSCWVPKQFRPNAQTKKIKLSNDGNLKRQNNKSDRRASLEHNSAAHSTLHDTDMESNRIEADRTQDILSADPTHNIGSTNSSITGDMEDVPNARPIDTPQVIVQHQLTVAGVKVNFPVKPYPCQIAVMNMVIKGCTKSQHCLLESPTGSGKTLALLCSALAWQDQYQLEVDKEYERIGNMSDESDFLEDGNYVSDYCDKYSAQDRLATTSTCETGPKLLTSGQLDEEMNRGHPLKVPKIYYGSRTHKQVEQVVRELSKTIYRNKKMTILSSREHTCIQDSSRNKTELCNELLDPVKGGGCPYYNEGNRRLIASYKALEKHGMRTPWDIEDLVYLGKQQGACPYFAARNLMPQAEIIFCPYNYLIDPDIRQMMQLDLRGEIIILDEAHNIEDICREVASVQFREDYLGMAVTDCQALSSQRPADLQTYSIIANYLCTFIQFLKSLQLQRVESISGNLSSPCWTGTELVELLGMNNLGNTKYTSFIVACKAAFVDFQKAKDDMRGPFSAAQPVISQRTKLTLEHITFALQMVSSDQFANDYRACVLETTVNDIRNVPDDTWMSKQRRGNRLRILKLICMNPGVIFSPLSQTARSIILASGTLAPTSSFQSELGTVFPNMLSANHVIPRSQVYVRCIPKGPNGVSLKANYENVNSWRFQDELGQVLTDVCQSVPHGVLCFFSSYHVMNTQIKRWKMNNYWNEIERMKRVFLEPRGGSDLAEVMKDYRSTIKDTSDAPIGDITGAVLFAVFRGKVAEGIDFSDNEARCVLAVGIPYAVRNDPTVQMKLQYNDLNISRGLLKSGEWYTVQAFRALNQALGRCIRHKNDWGMVFLVDERFQNQSNINYLPKWIKNLWIYSSNYIKSEELKNFVMKQLKREKEEGFSR